MSSLVKTGLLPHAKQSEHNSNGTCIVACEFSGGVVIGADCLARTESYVENRVVDKLIRITDHIYCCWSGPGSYTQAISDIVKYHLNFLKVEVGECPLVQTAGRIFRKLCYRYRDDVHAGVIVAGWDKNGGQVYSVPVGGMIRRQGVSIDGSGSPYVYGYVDANFRTGLTKDGAVELVTNALALAMLRDGSSGGGVRLGVITETGAERSNISGSHLPKFYEG